MRPLALLVVALLAGCNLLPTRFGTPPSNPDEMALYPHEVEYELLGTTSDVACASPDEMGRLRGYESKDPRAIGHGVLFEQAKYAAIEKAKADGLMSLRARVEIKNGYECVTVAGKAYLILSLRATAGHKAGDRAKPPRAIDSDHLENPTRLYTETPEQQ